MSMELVREFHKAFDFEINDTPKITADFLNTQRVALLKEELAELQTALNDRDVVETFDALLDLQYVLDGAFLSLGFHKIKGTGMLEVHRSNMSKLPKEGYEPVYNSIGKLVKPSHFEEPKLGEIIDDI